MCVLSCIRSIQNYHFHLLSKKVVDSIAPLPYKTHLVVEDGQVANKTSEGVPATKIVIKCCMALKG